MTQIDLTSRIGVGETVRWQGAPNKKAFILRSVLNPFLPVALLWAAIDIPFIVFLIGNGNGFEWFMIPFFLLHLAPVWIYLFGVLFAAVRLNHTRYLVTDRAVYISGGVFTVNVEMKPVARLSNVTVRQGIIERRLGVGSVILDDGMTSYPNNTARNRAVFAIAGIEEYNEVFRIIRDLQAEAYSDVMYPNALRPEKPDPFDR